jgi:putative two-component system hydrogenase maturation factor HypX/HoxX
MRILMLTHSFNCLAQRLHVALRRWGHEVSVELDVNDSVTREAVDLWEPEIILAPFLKRAIPPEVWGKVPCLIVHPGPPGDRGPSSLDRAILRGEPTWGVTVLQANGEMDGGPVWAHAEFPMRLVSKGSLYRREIAEGAETAVHAALRSYEAGASPVLPVVLGPFLPALTWEDRRIDWQRDATTTALRKIHASDGGPGATHTLFGQNVALYNACAGPAVTGIPGEPVARRASSISLATLDGSIWVSHLQAKTRGERGLKLPSLRVLGQAALALPEAPLAHSHGIETEDLAGLQYREEGDVAFLAFQCHNGAMGTEQCRALSDALRIAGERKPRVLVLEGGRDFFSNGMHLGQIEAADDPAQESLLNIEALDEVVERLITLTGCITVAAVGAPVSAGGAFAALACDVVLSRRSVVWNPHYRNVGNLYGSEYWTYVLPRRVGEIRANVVVENRLPLGAEDAQALGLVDDVFSGPFAAFSPWVRDRAMALSRDPFWRLETQEKGLMRERDEADKPLASYREEELARMRLNFFGFNPSYHVARYNLMRKVPKSRTPLYLARHRS